MIGTCISFCPGSYAEQLLGAEILPGGEEWRFCFEWIPDAHCPGEVSPEAGLPTPCTFQRTGAPRGAVASGTWVCVVEGGLSSGHEGSTHSRVGLEVLLSHEVSPEGGRASEVQPRLSPRVCLFSFSSLMTSHCGRLTGSLEALLNSVGLPSKSVSQGEKAREPGNTREPCQILGAF